MKYFELPKLKFDYADLEPNIDAETMFIHHMGHHKTYVEKLNSLISKHQLDLELKDLINFDGNSDCELIRNFAGGHYNHGFFFNCLCTNICLPKGELMIKIIETYGSFEKFKEEFENYFLSKSGSYWIWLVKTDKLEIVHSFNQEVPKGVHLMCVDGWEHAYYLKHKNKKKDYIKNIWNVINWKFVEVNFV